MHSAAIPNEQVLRSLKQAADRIQDLEARDKEAIAIVGIACRFPGGADDAESFWELVRTGRDAISPVPADRWSIADFEGKEPGEPGKITSREGGFLADVDRFDARFFGISGREAMDMDPQQRIALECAWQALENSGADWRALKGSRTGVFMGATTNDYARLCLDRMDPQSIQAHFATGNALNSIAGRISYTLGLEGPCLTIDTACSSSLAAVHLASRSLRSRECDLAIAGGVNLLLMPEASIATSRARMLSPDGRCKTFDSSADGYVRSEGCGAVVLMRLSDATRENRRIYASVLGSAINQNGESGGLTVPSRRAQERLIRDALGDARAAAHEIDYVEAHGTGTSLGDPIELNGLKDAYGEAQRSDPLLVGSVKSNIGHTESAAGIAGLIKATLALWHGEIPPSLHCQDPTPHFPWEGSGLRVCTELTAWPHRHERRAAVSSFGASGSNAHVILGGRTNEASRLADPAGPFLLALSAKSPRALQMTAERASEYLRRTDDHFPDLCRAVNIRRQWGSRLVVLANSCSEAGEALRRYCAGEEEARIFGADPAEKPKRKRARFLIDDNLEPDGVAIGDLYSAHSVYRDTLNGLDEELGRASPWLSALRAGGLPTGPADPAARFAVTVAEARFWRSWGLIPDEFVAGDQGLRAAAYLAQAVDIAWVRASLNHIWLETDRPHVPIFPPEGAAAAPPSDLSGLYATAGRPPSQPASQDDVVTLCPGMGAWRDAAAKAYIAGIDLAWSGLYPHFEVAPPNFPASVFERESFWPAERKPARSLSPLDPPLVDRHVEIPSLHATVVETDLRASSHPVFREHLVFGRIVVAGACHVALMLEASVRRWPRCTLTLTGVQFDRPLILGGSFQPSIQVALGGAATHDKLLAVSFDPDRPAADRTGHATASARADDLRQNPPAPEVVAAFAATCPNPLSATDFYEQLQRRTQIEHGQSFRWIQALSAGDNRAVGKLRAPPGAAADAVLDPGLIDSCFQMIAAAAGDGADGTFVPFSIGSLSVQPGKLTGELTALAQIEPPEGIRPNLARGQVRLFDEDFRLIASFEDLEFRKASPELLLRDLTDIVGPDHYTLSWSSIARGPQDQTLRDTIIVTSDNAYGQRLGEELEPALAGRTEVLALQTTSKDGLTLSEPDRQKMLRHLTAAAEQAKTLRILYMPRLTGKTDLLDHPEAALLDIVQEVARTRCSVELIIVTTSAVQLPGTGDAVNAHESGLWGFAAVLSREQTQLGLRILDVAREAPADAVIAALLRSGPGDRLLIRDGSLFEPSLSLEAAEDRELILRPDRSYLVTGAFGGLGTRIATDLVSRGARHLVLAGRRSETDDAIAFAHSLEAQGVTVSRHSVDVANRSAVRRLLEDVAATCPPLAGLVHAAAVLDDALVVDASWEQMQRVMDPKAVGAWNLHRETEQLDLSFFVLFSSASALIGTPGQAAYAAANATLDGIAALRRSLGLAASTIVWGPWADIGMTSRLSDRQRSLFSRAGIGLIRHEEGMRAFGRVACRPNTIVIKALSPAAINNAFATTPNRRSTAQPTSPAGAHSELGRDPEGVRAAVLQIAAEALRVPAESLALGDSLSALGVDSLIAMEISSSIADRFGVDLPLEDVMSDTSLQQIAGTVSRLLPLVEEHKPSARSPLESVGIDELAESIAALSDEEVAALLPQLLKN